MSWTAITQDDLLSAMSETESTAYRTKLIATGQTDPFDEIKEQVTREIRGAIRSNPRNSVDTDTTTLPASAHYHAVVLIRHRLLTRVDIEVSDARREEYRTAQSYLKQVAKDLIVESPTGADSDETDFPTPKVSAVRKRKFGRSNQDGI